MSSWIIYEHISPSGNIYVGITNRTPSIRWRANGKGYLTRQKNGKCNHPYFANAILKYGWDNFQHNIIASNLGEKTAKNMEKDLIKFYKEQGKSYNITDGGDGRLGTTFTHTCESKLLISKHHRRCQTGNTRKKISKVQTGRKFPKWRKELLSNSHSKEKHQVEQLTIDNILVATYNSIMDAERATGIRNGNISLCIKGKNKTAGGYKWKRINKYEIENKV